MNLHIAPNVWVSAILFNALWFAGVLGAAQGQQWPAVVTFVVLLLATGILSSHFRKDLQLAVMGVLVAYTIEPAWISRDLLDYSTPTPYNLPPFWIVLLWAAYGLCMNHCLAWIRIRWWLPIVLAASASLCSIYAAQRLGAVSFPEGFADLAIWYGSLWVIVTIPMAWLAARYAEPPETQSGPAESGPSA